MGALGPSGKGAQTNGGVLGGLPPGPGVLWERHASVRLFLKSLKRGRVAGGPRVGKYPQPRDKPLGLFLVHHHLSTTSSFTSSPTHNIPSTLPIPIWCECILSIASHVMFHINPIKSTTISSQRVFIYSNSSPYTGKATLSPYDTVICFSHLKRPTSLHSKKCTTCLTTLIKRLGSLAW